VSTEPRATSASPCQPATRTAGTDASDLPTGAHAGGEALRPRARGQEPPTAESLIPGDRGPMVERGPLKGGELNAAITSALVGIQTEYLGRGPRSASAFHYGNVLVTLMHDVLTPAERTLTRTDRTDAVKHIRHLFQETMETEFRLAVERLTGRKMLAFISGNHLEPDIAAELFILDEPL
jgi:uncharacterized protein YbcI